ncbi:hypothetical protein GOBAR_DD07043 [Gossypium barbadense]|nr:hypothetical protein GOBAR_DD07043 [Gossypium barbadense]
MTRLIRNDEHISDAANNEDSFRVLMGRVSVLKKAPDARLMPYLELAGFGNGNLWHCGTIDCVEYIRWPIYCNPPARVATWGIRRREPGGSGSDGILSSATSRTRVGASARSQTITAKCGFTWLSSGFGGRMLGPSDPYPQHHGTHSGSSSSTANEPQDFSSMYAIPPPAPNDDVGRRPGRDRRPPRRYTPRTTPSNHQF